MDKYKTKIVKKKGKHFTETERHSIIREMLKKNWTKQYAWELYTGELEERGQLLRWMRKLGYVGKIEHKQFVSKRSIRRFEVKSTVMAEKQNSEQTSFETLQLKKRIAELEKQLKDAEMKAIAYATMVDIAEKMNSISQSKKSSIPNHLKNENEFSSHRTCQIMWMVWYHQTGILPGKLERN